MRNVLLGYLGLMLALAYLVVWGFVFATPLLALFGLSILIAHQFADSASALSNALIAMIPFSAAFLVWIAAAFIGPGYLALLHRVGLVTQRVHKLTPSEALAIVRAQRLYALSTLPQSLRLGPYR